VSIYQSERPIIPTNIKREVKVEAGHQCSIKDCNEHTYLEIHHINEDREDNRKENLILLCGKHHKMAHSGIIDKKALRSYKEILKARSNSNDFLIGQERDRVHQFLKTVTAIFYCNDCGEISSVDSEAGYWFEQDIYTNLSNFFQSISVYNTELRSHDQSVRDGQDRIVDLMKQILDIRELSNYRYDSGYCATFIPEHTRGTPEYDKEITTQKKLVEDKLLKIMKLVSELWCYVENRLP
jgi:hypothetical protein